MKINFKVSKFIGMLEKVSNTGTEQHFSFDVIKWINSGYKVFNKIDHSKKL